MNRESREKTRKEDEEFEQKKTVDDQLNEYVSWLDTHSNEDKEVYETKYKELEVLFMKLSKATTGDMPVEEPIQSPDNSDTEPVIAEID